MKIYLVGGAVRDALLGRPVREKDYLVVGATVEEMLDQGFQPVGKAFPVFLHPNTKEEYALARTEKKVGKGYHGFTFHADPSVTLEEDLIRRDLTINAMAQDEAGQLIDPYGGKKDLENRILRHVSEAFVEDPVRILRIARFSARFAPLGFTLAPETLALMRTMVENGEVDALVPERVWKEMQSALCEPCPEVFFEVLQACGALSSLFPEISDWAEPLAALKASVQRTADPIIRFAVLMHSQDTKTLEAFSRHYRLPNEYSELANLVIRFQEPCHRALTLSAEELITLLESLDAFRRPERLDPLLTACHLGSPEADRIRQAYGAAAAVDTAALAQGLSGLAIREAIHQARVAAID